MNILQTKFYSISIVIENFTASAHNHILPTMLILHHLTLLQPTEHNQQTSKTQNSEDSHCH